MQTLVCIPAKGTSRGLPRKNLADLYGKPLVWWTIQQAKAAGVGPVVVSTDDAEIEAVAHDCGVLVRQRPPELATDEASTESVMLDLLGELTRVGDRNTYHFLFPSDFEAMLVLQPTSPLRLASHVSDVAEWMLDRDLDSVVTVTETHYSHWLGDTLNPSPAWPSAGNRQRMRRQDMPPQYTENGSIYAVRVKTFLEERTRFCGKTRLYVMPWWTQFEIDSYDDLGVVRTLLRQRMEQGADGVHS